MRSSSPGRGSSKRWRRWRAGWTPRDAARLDAARMGGDGDRGLRWRGDGAAVRRPVGVGFAGGVASPGSGLVDLSPPAGVTHVARPVRRCGPVAGREPLPVDAARFARDPLYARRVHWRVTWRGG